MNDWWYNSTFTFSNCNQCGSLWNSCPTVSKVNSPTVRKIKVWNSVFTLMKQFPKGTCNRGQFLIGLSASDRMHRWNMCIVVSSQTQGRGGVRSWMPETELLGLNFGHTIRNGGLSEMGVESGGGRWCGSADKVGHVFAKRKARGLDKKSWNWASMANFRHAMQNGNGRWCLGVVWVCTRWWWWSGCAFAKCKVWTGFGSKKLKPSCCGLVLGVPLEAVIEGDGGRWQDGTYEVVMVVVCLTSADCVVLQPLCCTSVWSGWVCRV